ncbi:hypothetical protein LAZ67_19000522 [Cordylochernes scorpioides]|uniref:Transposase n=1 Tax=Cordylochernes scorpioides TaxID=51811 RepID=A0ABY6LJE7_9ARAC|nr:hypothetical protein LAZ67_19000522 [Cordylochernes scorpioides]
MYIVFSDESHFLLCPDDLRKRVWRCPGQRVDPGLTFEHHTGPQQGAMVWGVILFDSRTPLVVIPGTLTAQRYVDDILRPVLLLFLTSPRAYFSYGYIRHIVFNHAELFRGKQELTAPCLQGSPSAPGKLHHPPLLMSQQQQNSSFADGDVREGERPRPIRD